MSKGDDDDALPPPRRSYMRGARLGAAVAGSRMAAAVESEAMRVKERILAAFRMLPTRAGWIALRLPRAKRFLRVALRTVAEITNRRA